MGFKLFDELWWYDIMVVLLFIFFAYLELH